jgi:putative sporulation protein YtaF
VEWGIPLLLALAVSVDGFSAGFSCGLRKLIIPFSSLLVICLLSAGAIAFSMLAGSAVVYLVPLRYFSAFGGAVLIIFGAVVMGQHYIKRGSGAEPVPEPREETSKEACLRRPKKITSLLQRPEEADLDRSGTLSAREALLLGSALAADAFAAGFGAALIGSPLLLTILAVGLTKLLLVPLGAALGRAARRGAPKNFPLLSGAILIVIGIINLF